MTDLGCRDCGFDREFCICGTVRPTPRDRWEHIGEAGRETLYTAACHGLVVSRKPSETMVIVENGRCTPHPLERVAKEWGCECLACCYGASVAALEAKPQLHEALARGGFHGAALVKAFLSSPDLAFPADIPEYAVRCWAYIQRQQQAEVAEGRRAATRASNVAAFEAAYRGKKT